MEQRPIVPLHDHVTVENPGASQAPASHQRPPTSGQPFQPRGGGHPSGRKTRGGLPKLPQEAPSLNTPVQDWVKFIQTYQNRYSGSDESSELSRVFPGELGITNGITPHTADDTIAWAHRVGNEYITHVAQALGISPERIAAYEAHTFEAGDVYILQEFAVTAALYDLPHLPRGDDQGMSGDPPAGTGEAEEGELPDWPALM
ncbi:hypothetical protein EDD17DRAFT_1510192 [Pisolithus thermaeus]|nr:hypothetical protein EDD17DRAFT_1510192 [Pisolithus thermaeus]